jgi:putative transcriptional regulator
MKWIFLVIYVAAFRRLKPVRPSPALAGTKGSRCIALGVVELSREQCGRDRLAACRRDNRRGHRRPVAGDPDAASLLSDEEIERALFADRVRAIRAALHLSQNAFAERFRIPAASLRDWEQGRRLPDAATQAYLTVIERDPRAVEAALADG